MPDNMNNMNNSSTGSTGGGMTTGSNSGSMASHGSSDTRGVAGMLANLGLDEQLINSMVDQWRGQLSETVTHKIQETDLREAFDKARELTSGSVERVKEFSQKNPKMFYSGLAAILVGAGLLAAAGRPAGDVDVTTTSTTTGSDL
jgi:hypothetical protein